MSDGLESDPGRRAITAPTGPRRKIRKEKINLSGREKYYFRY